MRIFGVSFAAGLLAAASAGCNYSSSSEKPAEVKPIVTTAESEASPEDGADGTCLGQLCVTRCDKLSRPEDCYRAGDAYRRGKYDVVISLPTGLKYLEKACARKSREGCYDLGRMFSVGDRGITQDVAQAIPWLTKACDLGRGQACDELAKHAENGEGMVKDHVKAIAWLVQGCVAPDFQPWTCSAFRKAVDAKDPEAMKAVQAWKTGCAAKEKAACAGLKRADLK